MKTIVLCLFIVVLGGCTQQVTVVSIEPTIHCGTHGSVMTTFDGTVWGRFQRCGKWGEVGDTFQLGYVL